ncbi:annexin D3-like [Asparagus officinalis]|uniref:annexin D3-like n=1 Tax=Asparagus officinalis TaxID=4686 RepID=UPI00098E555A|nr:annexin D3-like [Asparagus officinalis]
MAVDEAPIPRTEFDVLRSDVDQLKTNGDQIRAAIERLMMAVEPTHRSRDNVYIFKKDGRRIVLKPLIEKETSKIKTIGKKELLVTNNDALTENLKQFEEVCDLVVTEKEEHASTEIPPKVQTLDMHEMHDGDMIVKMDDMHDILKVVESDIQHIDVVPIEENDKIESETIDGTCALLGGELEIKEMKELCMDITIPKNLPFPEEDCKKLKKAFDGWGTDEDAVIEILAHRNARQRIKIADAYNRFYNESLIDRLHSELSSHFRVFFLQSEALKASKKKGDKHLWPIIEVTCASSPDHLIAVRKAYCTLFNYSLEEDIDLHLPQNHSVRQLLVRLVSSYRYDGEDLDEALARSEASNLHDAIISKQLHSEEVIRIIGTRSKPHLKATFKHYKQDYGKTIDEDLNFGCSGTILKCFPLHQNFKTVDIEGNKKSDELYASLLKVAVRCLDCPELHFAEVVRTSIVGLGTDEDSLTRAIVTRAEIDLKNIKEVYTKYGTSINDDIKGDTSGDYKKFLLALVGWDITI